MELLDKKALRAAVGAISQHIHADHDAMSAEMQERVGEVQGFAEAIEAIAQGKTKTYVLSNHTICSELGMEIEDFNADNLTLEKDVLQGAETAADFKIQAAEIKVGDIFLMLPDELPIFYVSAVTTTEITLRKWKGDNQSAGNVATPAVQETAYTRAVANGFTGTEEDYLSSYRCKGTILRTPTLDEWGYITMRSMEVEYAVFCSVNGIRGSIILPDDWDFDNMPIAMNAEISLEQWQAYEQAGAVFLPSQHPQLPYWSSTETDYDSTRAYTASRDAGKEAHLFVRLIRPNPNGRFTINEQGDKADIAKGNLQYIPATNTWQFAAHQYDYFGEDQSANGRDLFGWGDLTGVNNSTDPADYNWTDDWGTLIPDTQFLTSRIAELETANATLQETIEELSTPLTDGESSEMVDSIIDKIFNDNN